MKSLITLADIHEMLQDCSIGGATTFALSTLIKKVSFSEQVETLGIGPEGLIINPKFWTQHATTKALQKFLIWHELLHQVFRDVEIFMNKENLHLHYQYNIAMDARINSILYCSSKVSPTVFGIYDVAAVEKWLVKFYPKGIGLLLRPKSTLKGTLKRRCEKIYNYLWNNQSYYSSNINYSAESIRSQLPRRPGNSRTIIFIGSHGKEAPNNKPESSVNDKGEQLDQSALDVIRKAIADKLKNLPGGLGAGLGSVLEKLILLPDKSLKLNAKFIRDFGRNSCIAKLRKALGITYRKVPQVIPINPNNRELALLASGFTPFLWKNKRSQKNFTNIDLAIYLDVSGSVLGEDALIRKLIGAIGYFAGRIKEVRLFSNKVVACPMSDFLAGKLESTGGTDFDCIAKDALENKIDKAVVITDGISSLEDKFLTKLLENQIKLFWVLIGSSTDESEPSRIAKKLGTFVSNLKNYTE